MRRVLGGLLLGVLVGCSAPPASQTHDPIVARFDGGSVGLQEFRDWRRSQGETDFEVTSRRVEDLLLVRLLAQAGEEGGLREEARVSLRLAAIERQLWVAALRRHVADQTVVLPEEIEQALAEEPDAFQKPRRQRVRNLFLRVPATASAAERAEVGQVMLGLREQVVAGESFAALAREHSDSQTRFKGGLLGVVKPGELPPPVEPLVLPLEPGEVSSILETTDGFTIFYCETVWPAESRPPDEVRTKIESVLRQHRQKQRWQELVDELLEEDPPQFDLDFEMAPGQEPERRVLYFDDEGLSVGELRTMLRLGPAPRDLESMSLGLVREVLENYVVQVRASRRAQELGLSIDEGLLRWRWHSVFAAEEMARRVDAQLVRPTESELREAFGADRERYRRPAHYDLSLLRIAYEAGGERQAMQRALEAEEMIRGGRLSFEAAVRRYAPSQTSDPRTGWVARRRVAALGHSVLAAVEELSPGELSPPVVDGNRLYLLFLHGVEEPRALSFEEARSAVERSVGGNRVETLQNEISKSLRQRLRVTVLDPGSSTSDDTLSPAVDPR